MTRPTVTILALITATGLSAQEQQAGAAGDTDAAFQALVDACGDVDALMLRARIRLQLPLTTEEAAATAQTMLEEGFGTCAGGDLEGGKAILTEALALAEAGAEERFGAEAAAAEAEAVVIEAAQEAEPDSKPWWRFW